MHIAITLNLIFATLVTAQIYGMDYTARRGTVAPGRCPTYEEIYHDLTLIRPYANVIRIYNMNDCQQGNYTVRAAKDLGLKVILFIVLLSD